MGTLSKCYSAASTRAMTTWTRLILTTRAPLVLQPPQRVLKISTVQFHHREALADNPLAPWIVLSAVRPRISSLFCHRNHRLGERRTVHLLLPRTARIQRNLRVMRKVIRFTIRRENERILLLPNDFGGLHSPLAIRGCIYSWSMCLMISSKRLVSMHPSLEFGQPASWKLRNCRLSHPQCHSLSRLGFEVLDGICRACILGNGLMLMTCRSCRNPLGRSGKPEHGASPKSRTSSQSGQGNPKGVTSYGFTLLKREQKSPTASKYTA